MALRKEKCRNDAIEHGREVSWKRRATFLMELGYLESDHPSIIIHPTLRFLHPSNPSMHLATHIYPSYHSYTHPPIHPIMRACMHPFIYPSLHLSIHLSICRVPLKTTPKN